MKLRKNQYTGTPYEYQPIDHDEAPETGFRHSTYYHSFYQGYTEVRKLNSKGKYDIERIYTAPWKRMQGSDERYLRHKILGVILLLGSWLMFLGGNCMQVSSNLRWYVMIPGVFSVMLMLVTTYAELMSLTYGRNMTLWEHHNGPVRARRYSLAAGVMTAVTALLKIAAVVLAGNGMPAGEMVSVALVVGGSGLVSCLYIQERNTVYQDAPNENEGKISGNEIW